MPDETRTIYVRCTFVIPVEVPADWDDSLTHFDIEENHCPGTGLVGSALDDHMEKCDEKSLCWACLLGGTNEIVDGPLTIDVNRKQLPSPAH